MEIEPRRVRWCEMTEFADLPARYSRGTLKLRQRLDLPEGAEVRVTVRTRKRSVARRGSKRKYQYPDLTAKKPKLKRGRPSRKDPAARRHAQQSVRLQAKLADLFMYRYLFVKHHLTEAERKVLHPITRGLPHLRILREIMDEVYRLFDRRCRTETALAKLAHLRARVQRFQQVGQTLQPLFSANLEKALTFLDDRQLPATSNAVERGNRRHRKMQKTIYRVRTQPHIQRRIALDLLRASQAPPRRHTAGSLHKARAEATFAAGTTIPVGVL